jgi:uncharacterized membrane protein
MLNYPSSQRILSADVIGHDPEGQIPILITEEHYMKLLTALIAAVFSIVSFTAYAENAPASHDQKAGEMKYEEKREAKHEEKREAKHEEKREANHEEKREANHEEKREAKHEEKREAHHAHHEHHDKDHHDKK